MGKIVRAISADGGVICYAIDSTDIVADAKAIHKTSKTITAALGRLLTAASLMGSMLKGKDDSITLRMVGNGPVEALIAVSDSMGNVRGYSTDCEIEPELNQYGKLNVSAAIGNEGTLYVIKDLGLKEPYIGQSPIVSGEIAEDITNYFAASEQIPTVCALGVLVSKDNKAVISAGGYIIQLLPGVTDEEITRLEENINKLPSISKMIADGLTPEQIAFEALNGFDPNIIDEFNVKYKCNCSRERVERMLISLGREELLSMADEQKLTEVDCHFCNKKHRFNSEELRELAK